MLQGDSGGPLLLKSPSGKYTIAGIVSFGYGCGEQGLPGIYTDVGCYMSWILDKTKRPVSKIPRDQYHQVNNYGFIGSKGQSRPNFQDNSPLPNPQMNYGNPGMESPGYSNFPSQTAASPPNTKIKFMDNRAIPRKTPKNK